MTTITPPTGLATTPAATNDTPRAYDWRDDAACRETDPELFFPVAHTNGWKKQTKNAKKVCSGCSVLEACLEWALDAGVGGIWGGMSERQRRALRGDAESQAQRCLDRQVWIEKQVAAGMSQREIADRLRVDKTSVSRAISKFNRERETAGEVQAP